MKEALNQFMSDYLTNFRLSDFYPGPTCQITPPFLFAMVSVDVLLSQLSAPQHNLMVATSLVPRPFEGEEEKGPGTHCTSTVLRVCASVRMIDRAGR